MQKEEDKSVEHRFYLMLTSKKAVSVSLLVSNSGYNLFDPDGDKEKHA